MAERNVTEELIRHAWHTYLTQGEIPASLNSPWFERNVLPPFPPAHAQEPALQYLLCSLRGHWGKFLQSLPARGAFPAQSPPVQPLRAFATEYHGGVELEISMLFVDVRGSTAMAESVSPEAFSRLINRFYSTVTEVFYRHYGFVEKLQGSGDHCG